MNATVAESALLVAQPPGVEANDGFVESPSASAAIPEHVRALIHLYHSVFVSQPRHAAKRLIHDIVTAVFHEYSYQPGNHLLLGAETVRQTRRLLHDLPPSVDRCDGIEDTRETLRVLFRSLHQEGKVQEKILQYMAS